jgi:hypothetical protein
MACTVAVMVAVLSLLTLGCSAGAAPLVDCANVSVDRDSANTKAAARINTFFILSISPFFILIA